MSSESGLTRRAALGMIAAGGITATVGTGALTGVSGQRQASVLVSDDQAAVVEIVPNDRVKPGARCDLVRVGNDTGESLTVTVGLDDCKKGAVYAPTEPDGSLGCLQTPPRSADGCRATTTLAPGQRRVWGVRAQTPPGSDVRFTVTTTGSVALTATRSTTVVAGPVGRRGITCRDLTANPPTGIVTRETAVNTGTPTDCGRTRRRRTRDEINDEYVYDYCYAFETTGYTYGYQHRYRASADADNSGPAPSPAPSPPGDADPDPDPDPDPSLPPYNNGDHTFGRQGLTVTPPSGSAQREVERRTGGGSCDNPGGATRTTVIRDELNDEYVYDYTYVYDGGGYAYVYEYRYEASADKRGTGPTPTPTPNACEADPEPDPDFSLPPYDCDD